MQRRVVLAASMAGVSWLSGSTAQAGIDLSSAFDPTDFWQPLTAGGGFATQAFSGGNPGGYMQLTPFLSGPPPFQGGAGAYRPQVYFGFQIPEFTHVVIDAEARFVGGAGGGTLIPVVFQSGTIFAPLLSGEVISSSTFQRTPTRAYNLADFEAIYPRIPGALRLNPGGVLQFGFLVRLQSDVLSPSSGNYAVDNVRLIVVPAPGAGGIGCAALGLLSVRRRARRCGVEIDRR